ncbi:hypothetical protein Tco_0919086 [Tanacetum coccineum]
MDKISVSGFINSANGVLGFSERILKLITLISALPAEHDIPEDNEVETRSLDVYGMMASMYDESDSEDDVSAEECVPAEVVISADDVVDSAEAVDSADCVVVSADCSVSAGGAQISDQPLAFVGELAYEEKIRVLSYDLADKSNILEYKEKLINQASQEKQELLAKLDKELANQEKWRKANMDKNLFKLIDSSYDARTKQRLGFHNLVGDDDWGFGNSKFSVFTPDLEDIGAKPIYNRFDKVDHMKAVPPPMTRNYMPTSNASDDNEDSKANMGIRTLTVSNPLKCYLKKQRHWEANSKTFDKAKDRGIVDIGCSRSMSGNRDKLEDFVAMDGGEVTFGGGVGHDTGKGTY